MKKLLGLLFLSSLIVFIGSAYGKEKIKIGYFKLEPHTISEANKHSGALIELWENQFAPAMDVEIEWQGPLPPSRLFAALKDGEINAIALLAKNPDREKTFDFPKEMFFAMEAGIALLKENKLEKINTADDLFGLNLGFFKDGFIPPALKNDKIKWDLVSAPDWQQVNFTKLTGNRIDGAFNPENLSLVYEANKTGLKDKIKVLTVPNTSASLYSVFSKKDNGKFLEKYNQALSKFSLKEKYKELIKKYMGK
jgi:polar amino acid transport system substrate-binding protein